MCTALESKPLTKPADRKPRWATCPARVAARSRRHAAISAAAIIIFARDFGLRNVSAKLLLRHDQTLRGRSVLWTFDLKMPRKHEKLKPWEKSLLSIVGEASVSVWDARLRGAKPDWGRETSDPSLWLGCDPSILPTIARCCENVEFVLSSPDYPYWDQLVQVSRKLIKAAR